MPHINFNVPFISETGDPVMTVKYDLKKLRIGTNGQPSPLPVLDEEGNAVQEGVFVHDLLVRILSKQFPGDENVTTEDKVKRGKLAQKIHNNNSAHYNDNEIKLIVDLVSKAGTTMLVTQVDGLINGTQDIVVA